jgi:hypothetical protein
MEVREGVEGGCHVEVAVVMDRRRNSGGVIGIIKKRRGYRGPDVQVNIALVYSSAWACFVGFG